MYIRTSTESDSADLAAFKAAEWPAADREHYGEHMPNFSRSNVTIVAEENDEIIGYRIVATDTGVALVDSLIVAATHRGKGIAKALVEAMENIARESGCHKIWLETGAQWKARFVYEKLGYTLRTTLPNHYGGQDFLYYDKNLRKN